MKRAAFWFIFLLFSLAAAPSLAVDTIDYLVGEGDVLKVTVYDHPDLTTTLRVSNGGTVLFPLIGQLQIANLTVDQVAGEVASMLSEGYIVNPQVSVFVEEFRSKKVTIIGQVENPGLYELSGPTTLLELISKAGGPAKDYGDTLTIHRKDPANEGMETVFTVEFKNILEEGTGALEVPLMDGDSVVVAKASVFYVTGEVSKPDAYRFEEGTTVIKAITMAGGFSSLAARGKVKIYRKIEGVEHVAEKVSMDEPILPDDVIVVPESFF